MLRGNRTVQLSFFLFYYSGGEGTKIGCLAKKSLLFVTIMQKGAYKNAIRYAYRYADFFVIRNYFEQAVLIFWG